MKELVKEVKNFCTDRNWLNQPPGDVAKSIVIEAAELLEHFQWSDFFDEDATADPAIKAKVAEELADVFIYCIEMSIVLNVDIADIVRSKLAKAAIKYPPKSVIKLGSKEYRRIKTAHRKKAAH